MFRTKIHNSNIFISNCIDLSVEKLFLTFLNHLLAFMLTISSIIHRSLFLLMNLNNYMKLKLCNIY